MTDERFTFVQDVRDKKRTAHGASHKVRGGGRTVKMPSDYMTRRERLQMNGECVSYNLNAPMTWKEFKRMPDDLQVKYIGGLVEKYSANAVWIADMMGVNSATLRVWAKSKNYTFGHVNGHSAKNNRPYWDNFLTASAPAEVNPVEVTEEQPEELPKEEPPKVEANLNNIAVLLSMLAGTGAKLTIEVTL